MLRKFSVSNFKNFDKEITLDLSAGRYDFNTHCIKNKIVNTAVIFGYNASGKSNFALALFDIVSSITDYNTLPEKYAITNTSQDPINRLCLHTSSSLETPPSHIPMKSNH